MERWGLQRKYKSGGVARHPSGFKRGHRHHRESRPIDGYLECGEVQAGIKPSAKVGIIGRVMERLFGRRAG